MTGHGNKYRLLLSLSMTLLTGDDDSNDCHALVVAHLLHLQVYLIIWYWYVYLAIAALWLLGVTFLQQFPIIISLLITETRARDPKVWGINRFQCLKLFLIGLKKPLECQWILSIGVYKYLWVLKRFRPMMGYPWVTHDIQVLDLRVQIMSWVKLTRIQVQPYRCIILVSMSLSNSWVHLWHALILYVICIAN